MGSGEKMMTKKKNRSRTAGLLLSLMLPGHVFPLQVTPNSPCASVCVDRENLDLGDPNSSNTGPSDLTCKDAEYAKTHIGVKWQNCMTCLQTSSFSQGSESDQGWFLCMSLSLSSFLFLFFFPLFSAHLI